MDERQHRRLQRCTQNLSPSYLLLQRRLWTTEHLEIGMPEQPDRPTIPTYRLVSTKSKINFEAAVKHQPNIAIPYDTAYLAFYNYKSHQCYYFSSLGILTSYDGGSLSSTPFPTSCVPLFRKHTSYGL